MAGLNRSYLMLAFFCVLTISYQNCGTKTGFTSQGSVSPASGDLVAKQTSGGVLTPPSVDGDDSKLSCETQESKQEEAFHKCMLNARDNEAKEKACKLANDRVQDQIEDVCEKENKNGRDANGGVLCFIKKIEVRETDRISRNCDRDDRDKDDKLAFLEKGHDIPQEVCMSQRACLVMVNDFLIKGRGRFTGFANDPVPGEKRKQLTRFEENGVCKRRKNIIWLTDDQVRQSLAKFPSNSNEDRASN